MRREIPREIAAHRALTQPHLHRADAEMAGEAIMRVVGRPVRRRPVTWVIGMAMALVKGPVQMDRGIF